MAYMELIRPHYTYGGLTRGFGNKVSGLGEGLGAQKILPLAELPWKLKRKNYLEQRACFKGLWGAPGSS